MLLIAVDQFRYDYLTRFRGGVHRRPVAAAHARRDLHAGLSRSLPHRHGGRPFDDAERRDSGGERHRRQRLVRPRARHERDQRLGSRHAAGGGRGPGRVAATTAGEHARRRDEERRRAPAGRERAEGLRAVAEGSVGDSAGRPSRRRRLLARRQEGRVRHEHALSGRAACLGGAVQPGRTGRQVRRAQVGVARRRVRRRRA